MFVASGMLLVPLRNVSIRVTMEHIQLVQFVKRMIARNVSLLISFLNQIFSFHVDSGTNVQMKNYGTITRISNSDTGIPCSIFLLHKITSA